MNIEWLEKCAQAGEFLYGVYPVEVLMKLYETREHDKLSVDEVIDAVVNSPAVMMECVDDTLPIFTELGYSIPGFFKPYVPDDGMAELRQMFKSADEAGNPYADMHLDPDEWELLVKDQIDVDFFIPTADQIEQLIDEGYIDSDAYGSYRSALEKAGVDESFIVTAWQQISTDKKDTMDAMGYLIEPISAGTGSIEELNSLMPAVMEFYNNVNLRNRRGWAPAKLSHLDGLGPSGLPTTIVPGSAHAAKQMAQLQPFFQQNGMKLDLSGMGQYTQYGNYGEARKVKIYPNDPCPCGSGKKYKKCCGRKGGIKAAGQFTVKL